MKAIDVNLMRQAVNERRMEWRKHVLQKLAERCISQDSVIEVILNGERIRNYTDDRPFPSALFLGYVGDKPLHVVAAYDETKRLTYIITAYEPSLDIFESDYKTRKYT